MDAKYRISANSNFDTRYTLMQLYTNRPSAAYLKANEEFIVQQVIPLIESEEITFSEVELSLKMQNSVLMP